VYEALRCCCMRLDESAKLIVAQYSVDAGIAGVHTATYCILDATYIYMVYIYMGRSLTGY
jgi:hypothetical protein